MSPRQEFWVKALAVALFAFSANSTASLVLSTLVSFGPAVWMRSTFFAGCAAAAAAKASKQTAIKERMALSSP